MKPFVRATVVRAQRPTSVRAGDSAVVSADGTIEGFVGGTCAEASVRLHALRCLETGEPLLLKIVPGDAAGDAEEGAVVEANPCLSGGALELFLEPHIPAPVLRVVGDTPIARALAELAVPLGFDLGGDDGAAPAALVVASHGRDEDDALASALQEGVAYVGLVASRKRGAAVVAGLEVPDALRARVRTPAGLDIGARTPEEIALSILAEIVAARRATEALPPIVAIDPVCGMEVAATPVSIRAEFDGQTVYFCGTGCRDTFAARHAGAS